MKLFSRKNNTVITTLFCFILILSLSVSCSTRETRETPIDTALEVARAAKEGHDKDVALNMIATHYADLGEHDNAIRIVEMIPDTSAMRATALLSIAMQYLDKGKHAKARELAERTEEISVKLLILQTIAHKYVLDGEEEHASEIFGQCLRIANTIDDDFNKAGALTQIAQTYGDLDNRDKANELLNQALIITEGISDTAHEGSKYEMFMTLGKGYGKIGKKDTASMLLKRAQEMLLQPKAELTWWLRNNGLYRLGLAYLEYGACEEAMKVAELIEPEPIESIDHKGTLLVYTVKEYVKSRDYEQAFKIAKVLKNSNRGAALQHIVQAYAQEGQFDKALDLTQEINDVRAKVGALAFVSVRYMDAGKDSAVAQLLSQMGEIATSIKEPYPKTSALIVLANVYIKNENYDKAFEILMQAHQAAVAIEDTSDKSHLLPLLAIRYANIGHYTEALEVAQTMPDTWQRVSAIVAADSAYRASGAKVDSKAKEILREIKQEYR